MISMILEQSKQSYDGSKKASFSTAGKILLGGLAATAIAKRIKRRQNKSNSVEKEKRELSITPKSSIIKKTVSKPKPTISDFDDKKKEWNKIMSMTPEEKSEFWSRKATGGGD